MVSESSVLYQEIQEQPAVLARLLTEAAGPVADLAAAMERRQIRQVVIAARGSSDNAGRYAQYLLGAQNRLLVGLATPSLFTIYQRPPALEGTLVLGISQSGRSPDIVAVLAEGRRQGALTAAITNEPASDLAGQADHVLALHTGRERAVAATKTYTAELALVALLGVTLAGDEAARATLDGLPGLVARTLAANEAGAREIVAWQAAPACVVVGRGYNYATVYELALKLKELTHLIAEPYSSADFMHGPVAVVEPNFPVLLVAPSGLMLPEMRELAQLLRSRGAELAVISDAGELLEQATIALPLPAGIAEWLSPIPAIVPGQLLAYHLALARGLDPDRPRGLRKVTKTV